LRKPPEPSLVFSGGNPFKWGRGFEAFWGGLDSKGLSGRSELAFVNKILELEDLTKLMDNVLGAGESAPPASEKKKPLDIQTSLMGQTRENIKSMGNIEELISNPD